MNVLDSFQLVAAVVGLVATVPIYQGWFRSALSWNKFRQREKILSERKFFERLHTSDREYIGWLLHSLLLVVTLFSVALMFRSVELNPAGAKLVAALHWVIGGCAYAIAVNSLGTYHRLRTYATTIGRLDERLKRLGS